MKKGYLSFYIIVLIISFPVISSQTFASAEVRILTSDHFKINYDLNNSSYAVASAVKLEAYHDIIGSFLGIDSLDRLSVSVSGENSIKILPVINDEIINDLPVNPDKNFNIFEYELYCKIFRRYLREVMQNGKGISLIDRNFFNAIAQYPAIETPFIETILSDLVDTVDISSIDLRKIKKYGNDEQRAIYTGFIHFIISSYGKKILIQSFKDADYYDGYFNSLSMISGDSIDKISDNYKLFLQKRKDDLPPETENSIQLLHGGDEYSDISFSFSENGECAVLQKNNKVYRILRISAAGNTVIPLQQSANSSVYNNIVFYKNDNLAIVEIFETGSVIYIYNLKNNVMVERIDLPFLLISDINTLNTANLIFSAVCGLSSDIYTLNIKTREFNILTETGNNFFPVAAGDKIYFVSNNDKSNIIEIDTLNGKRKTIFSNDQKISNLEITDNNMTFSMKINGLENIFLYDIYADKLRQITSDNKSNIMPGISGLYIYYFTFFKSRYQLFYKLY